MSQIAGRQAQRWNQALCCLTKELSAIGRKQHTAKLILAKLGRRSSCPARGRRLWNDSQEL